MSSSDAFPGTQQPAPPPGPLAGIRVVELAGLRSDYCGRVLADLGAEVISVEPPGGAPERSLGVRSGAGGTEGDSLLWLSTALGKRSVIADLADPGDRAAVANLAATADVFVESFDPGTVARELGYASLSARNPGLVYVSVTPFGQDGPDAASPATDLTLQAAGGLVGLQGDGDRPPVPVGGAPQAYFHAGAQAAADVLVALHERARSGRGQRLDVSAQAAVVWTLMNATGFPPNQGGNPPFSCETRAARREILPGIELPPVWPCRDGAVTINFSLPVVGGRTLQALAAWMEREAFLPAELRGRDWSNWAADVVAGTLPVPDLGGILRLCQVFVRTKTKAELQAFALETGTILSPIYTVEDIANDPQLAARDYFREVDGRRHTGPFVKAPRTPLGPWRGAPRAGADQELLRAPREAGSLFPPPGDGPRTRAFEGLKVADFSWVGVGPVMAKALADHGATVVRVESEARPDVLRLLIPFKDSKPGINRSQFWANFNTSKLGLALDLGTEQGRALAHRLVAWADVVVESFTPGTMAKWGLDYPSLARGRDDLVMISTSLRGRTGPEAAITGFGGQGAALAGLHSLTGWPDRLPCGPWGAYTDFIAPRMGFATLAAALLHRARTGEGQHLDMAQSEAGIRFIEPQLLDYFQHGRTARARGTRSEYATPSGVFACAGERFVAIGTETPGQWRRLVAALELTAFAGPEFLEAVTRRVHEDAIEAAIAAWCAPRDAFGTAEWLKAHGVPAAAVAWPSDLYGDRQLAHRGFFVTLDHAEMGPTPYDGLVTKFSATPGALRAAPCLGEHTHEVLTEILGCSPEEIGELAIAGAIN